MEISDAADAAVLDAPETVDATDASRGDGDTAADAHEGPAVDLRFDGIFPIKVLAHGRRFLVVLEKPVSLQAAFGQPSRSVRWMDPDGRIVWSRGSS